MRTLIRAGALTAGVCAAVVAVPAAHASPRGDNGTVKIHDAATGAEARRNEPHVCSFYLDAFGFDGGQQVAWHIEAWAPTAAAKGVEVKSGSIVLDAEGAGRTPDLSLPDGHYKLFWNFDGEKGAAKQKVFWTDCAASGGPSASVSVGASVSADASVSAGASVPAGSAASPSASAGAGAAVSSSPSPQGGAGDLAETGAGAPVGALSAAAAALLAAGGYLVFRRRAVRRG
ncbi:LPXTG cell wall anchor domain-containing protein [Streptomyces sp. NPDC014864]|uniref:LPXTG cell wall anchor domain-containing protein n=1 Tax=Streptomyces sp. NPDC014864 TaxID=3364924 RepID=UPI0036FD2B46